MTTHLNLHSASQPLQPTSHPPSHQTTADATAANPTDAIWRRTVLIGTAETVAALARQLETPGAPMPVGCLLLRPAMGRVIKGIPVLGTVDDLPAMHSADPLSCAIVSFPASQLPSTLKVRATLRQLGILERFVPTLTDVLAQSSSGASVHGGELDLVELIGRTPYGIDRRAVARVIEGKRVLITGAGGSIGSELCRIAATFRPSQLVMMERSENALFEIDRQIARRFPDIQRRAVLHDVADDAGTLRHMVVLKPHTVFHAAAHKHVPLMEDHPSHAVTNNLFGTKSIADAALAVGTERFVMISSDKAVNPTSVMGATKRLAEMYVQAMNDRSPKTSFTMVRFGNVLGSACSVLPIWTSQLAEGGPITVTDPRMTRYFMTINEAATLVIQAAAVDAHDTAGNQPSPTILVLDMGEPLKILDLARRFVRLHGFDAIVAPEPGTRKAESQLQPIGNPGIEIIFTGARPGEKLHEELAYTAEALLPTPYPGIMALAASTHADFDITAMIAELSAVRSNGDRETVVTAIRRHVPEMRAADTVQNQTTKQLPRVAAA